MRWLGALLSAGLLAGCATNQPPGPLGSGAGTSPPSGGTTNRHLIVTPGQTIHGRVASVNAGGRFVVLTFPLGTMPALEKRLNVYREGLKVGELKVTGPQLDINIDADITAGECRVGDEVRED